MLWTHRVRIIITVAAIAAAAVLLRLGEGPSLFERAAALVLKTSGATTKNTLSPFGDNESIRKEARRQSVLAANLQRENAFLRLEIKRLGFQKEIAAPPRGIIAAVTGREPETWSRSVTISPGSNKGIKSGYIATTGNGLAGIVTSCAPEMCKVRLLTDPASAASCVIEKKKSKPGGQPRLPLFCIAFGAASENLNAALVAGEAAAGKGDLVVTSGYGRYPRGIPIGVITGGSRSTAFPAEGLSIAPAVNFNNLDFLLISPP